MVIGVQSLVAVAISSTIIKVFGMGNLMSDVTMGDVKLSVLTFFSMYCSNYSLKFVNYPLMVLAKSAKILPVILTGWLTGVYKLTRAQVVIGITISSGLVIFNSAKVRNASFANDSPFGILLVILSLLFDGFVSIQTDMNHRSSQKRSGFAYHSMLYINLGGLLGNALFFMFSYLRSEENDARDTLDKVLTEWNVLRDVLLIGICGGFG